MESRCVINQCSCTDQEEPENIGECTYSIVVATVKEMNKQYRTINKHVGKVTFLNASVVRINSEHV